MSLIILALDMKIKKLLADEHLVEGDYMQSANDGAYLVSFAEKMEGKIEKLISEDNKFLK